MNEPPVLPPFPPAPASPEPEPIKPKTPEAPVLSGTGIAACMEILLKNPSAALAEFTNGPRAARLSRSLLLLIVAGMVLFGVVAVDFSHGIQWWAAPLKMTGGLFLAALLCLPSLYIFACLSGLEIRLRTVIGLLLSALALTSLMLVGFAPVVWVFSQSSDSLPFMGFVMILIWSVSLFFGLKLLSRQARALGMVHSLDLRLWMGIFVLVTFQMSCALRPLLGHANSFLPTQKRFFLEHWGEQLGRNGRIGKPVASPASPIVGQEQMGSSR